MSILLENRQNSNYLSQKNNNIFVDNQLSSLDDPFLLKYLKTEYRKNLGKNPEIIYTTISGRKIRRSPDFRANTTIRKHIIYLQKHFSDNIDPYDLREQIYTKAVTAAIECLEMFFSNRSITRTKLPYNVELADISKDEDIARRKACNPKFWERKIKKLTVQRAELIAFELKFVGKKQSVYVSPFTLDRFVQNKRMETDFLNSYQVVNHDTGESLPLAAVARSDYEKICEIACKAKGYEHLAFNHYEYTWLFLTATLPPEYHPNPTLGKNSWTGLTPRQGIERLQKNWRNFTRSLNNMDIHILYLWCTEPHKDGCPHRHMLVYCAPEHRRIVYRQFAKYFHFGPKSIKVERPNKAKGATPTSYITKYLLKAVNCEQYFDHKIEDSVNISAHAWCWKYRKYQFGGIQNLTGVWRELRFAHNVGVVLPEAFRQAQQAAVDNQFCDFIVAWQKIAGTWSKSYAGAISPYGEISKRLCGFENLETGQIVITRWQRFGLVRALNHSYPRGAQPDGCTPEKPYQSELALL